YINSVQKIFGKKKLKTFPNMALSDFIYYRYIKGIREVPLLTFIEYDQKKVGEMLEREAGWTYYGGHHHESYYTHFFQSYYLPKKFGIDKRKVEYSALIRSKQMNRAAALTEIETVEYPYDEELVKYAKNKLGLSDKEFDAIMGAPRKSFQDYPTYYPLIKSLSWLIKLATKMRLVPKHVYYKFLG
ncbi:MAG: N-acetyl sugar amidotransferase, partial [Candidatus Omnitrophica bacterium]|nr:N-acetyl sugar amidotransferase [Candidatus Omnitrophota bacterium]